MSSMTTERNREHDQLDGAGDSPDRDSPHRGAEGDARGNRAATGSDSSAVGVVSTPGSTTATTTASTTGSTTATTPAQQAVAGTGYVPVASSIPDSIRDLITAGRRFEEHLGRALSIGPTDLLAMEHLMQDGAMGPGELANRLGVSTAASTMVVDRLVALGHAQRHPHPSDRRRVVVEPSPDSVQLAVGELMPMIIGVSTIVRGLDDADRIAVERFLAQVVDVYERSIDAG